MPLFTDMRMRHLLISLLVLSCQRPAAVFWVCVVCLGIAGLPTAQTKALLTDCLVAQAYQSSLLFHVWLTIPYSLKSLCATDAKAV